MSANTMEANNEVFSEPLRLKALNPGSLRKKVCFLPTEMPGFHTPCIGSDLLQQLYPEKGPKEHSTEKQSAAAVQSQDPQLIDGSAQRGMEVRRKPEIHTDRFVVSQRRHYHKYS